ncbi:MAG TPA: GNAT family N-acetyltransferase [Terriglobales bacterium]|nr:GNAT family N-acetyltransferase [Terriglobales bacterium]
MHPLDNVIWNALTTKQAHLGTTNHAAGKFLREVSLLGALAEPTGEAYESLLALLRTNERVGLFLDETPQPSPPLKLVRSGPLLQMVHEHIPRVENPKERPAFLPLGRADVPHMLALTQLTKPGPFGERTHEMGEYWGIRQNGELIAMAGERLRLPGFTEVSAVCTHPDHLGRGYATALITMLVQRIRSRGEQPFLHVLPENTRAVCLYEYMGFHKRALRQYVILERK